MSLPVLVYVATAVAVAVVVATRLRMRGRFAARVFVGRRPSTVHTVCGVLGAIVWIAFLVAPADSFLGSASTGIVGLGLWWVVTVAGLFVLARWLPARGKHASPTQHDSWSTGPLLSVLGHLLMVGAVAVMTYGYLSAAV